MCKKTHKTLGQNQRLCVLVEFKMRYFLLHACLTNVFFTFHVLEAFDLRLIFLFLFFKSENTVYDI